MRSRISTASMAFTLISGSALPVTNNGAAGFASCYGPLSRSP